MAGKLTEEVQIQICAMISVGCSVRTAARLTGCAESTVRNRLKNDRAFAARFRKAELQRELLCLRHVQFVGEKNWRAAAWLLDRANTVDADTDDSAPPAPKVKPPQQAQRVQEQFTKIIRRNIRDSKLRREVESKTNELFDHFWEFAGSVKAGRES